MYLFSYSLFGILLIILLDIIGFLMRLLLNYFQLRKVERIPLIVLITFSFYRFFWDLPVFTLSVYWSLLWKIPYILSHDLTPYPQQQRICDILSRIKIINNNIEEDIRHDNIPLVEIGSETSADNINNNIPLLEDISVDIGYIDTNI
jgi:hypothetical protein